MAGFSPGGATFDALIQDALEFSDLETVDDLFVSSLSNGNARLRPHAGSLDIVIKHCVEDQDGLGDGHGDGRDMLRAAKYANMARHRFRPTLASYLLLIQGYICRGEARRAHSWMEWLIENGFQEKSNYPHSSRSLLREAWAAPEVATFDARSLVRAVLQLCEALADIDNARTADKWLQYLSESGVDPQEFHSTWEHVRNAYPPNIIDAKLAAEMMVDAQRRPWRTVKPKPVPAQTLAAKLSGETVAPDRGMAVKRIATRPYRIPALTGDESWLVNPKERRQSWRDGKRQSLLQTIEAHRQPAVSTARGRRPSAQSFAGEGAHGATTARRPSALSVAGEVALPGGHKDWSKVHIPHLESPSPDLDAVRDCQKGGGLVSSGGSTRSGGPSPQPW